MNQIDWKNPDFDTCDKKKRSELFFDQGSERFFVQ